MIFIDRGLKLKTHSVSRIRRYLYAAGMAMQLLSIGAVQAELPVSRQSEILHLIRHDCGSCHGMTLKGGLGPPLTVERLGQRLTGELAGIIRNGIRETPMPPWEGILNDEEIAWMVKQLQQGLQDEHPD
jgi:cytochrome c55X